MEISAGIKTSKKTISAWTKTRTRTKTGTSTMTRTRIKTRTKTNTRIKHKDQAKHKDQDKHKVLNSFCQDNQVWTPAVYKSSLSAGDH